MFNLGLCKLLFKSTLQFKCDLRVKQILATLLKLAHHLHPLSPAPENHIRARTFLSDTVAMRGVSLCQGHVDDATLPSMGLAEYLCQGREKCVAKKSLRQLSIVSPSSFTWEEWQWQDAQKGPSGRESVCQAEEDTWSERSIVSF